MCFYIPNGARGINRTGSEYSRICFVPIKRCQWRTIFRRFVIVEQTFLGDIDSPSTAPIIGTIPNAQIISSGREQVLGGIIPAVGTPQNLGAGIGMVKFTRLVEGLALISFGGVFLDNVNRVGILFHVTTNGEAKLGIGFAAASNKK